MSTKTKYGKRGIAALCGAAVLFAGEVSPVNAFAEQTEKDAAVTPSMSMEAPTDEGIYNLTEATETMELPAPESNSETGEIPAETSVETEQKTEPGPDTGQPDRKTDRRERSLFPGRPICRNVIRRGVPQ